MDRSTPTMASLLRDRDAEHFVGREGPLALVDAVLQPVTATMGAPRVLLVHGPGGIGKSTLLREIGRRGEALGWTVIAIDGRGLDHGPTAAADALAAARTAARPLVLIDTFEVVAGLAGHLRTEVLPALPATAVVVIAGRGAPDSEWFRGGWEHLTRAIPLPPFTREEATALLAAAGATDPDVVRRALAWTRGSPLALATIAAADAGEATAMGTVAEADVLRRLAAILVDEESAGRHLDALVVAAFARTFDIELVRALVPDADAGEELAWLAERTFVERHGSAYAIHDLVGHVLRLDLTGRDPELVRDLRRRLADHTHARARRRRQPISLDLAHLIDDPAIRWGFGEGFRTHRLDDVRDGDAEVLHARLEATGDHDHWCRVAPYLRDAPDRVTVLRDHRDRLTGFTVTITPAHAPRCVADDPLLSAWLAHARRQPDADDTVLWLCATNFEDDPEGRAQGLLGLAGFLKSRLARVRRCYLPITPDSPGGLAFSRAAGAVHHVELDHRDARGVTECHIADFGPGGALGALLAVVYAEVGADPGHAADPTARVDHVRDALRHLTDDRALATSPLAPPGVPKGDAAAAVRDRLARAIEAALADDAELRAVLDHGYLRPAPHDVAARTLYLSRATYFRRLRVAIERVAEVIDQVPV